MRYSAEKIRRIQREDDHYRVFIEQYHRSSAGIFPGSTTFIVPEPHEKSLIISPINPDSWGDLWRMDVVLKNIPGALNACLTFFEDKNINVLPQESSAEQFASQRTAEFRAKFYLDLCSYVDLIDQDTTSRNTVEKPDLKPFGLLGEFCRQCAKYLVPNMAINDWDVNIERMEYFFSHKELRKNAKRASTEKSWLKISQFAFMPFGGDINTADENLSYYSISDSEEKYVKVRLLDDKSLPTMSIKVRHAESIGVIREITQVLFDKEINIICSHNRMKEMGEIAFWNAVVESSSQESILQSIDEIIALSTVSEVVITSNHNVDEKRLLKYLSPRAGSKGKSKENQKHSTRKHQIFVACPYNEKHDNIFDNIISPTVNSLGFEAVRVDRPTVRKRDEALSARIERMISEADLVIADVTGKNENVLIEAGYALGAKKDVLFLCDTEITPIEEIPFDIQHKEVVKYKYGFNKKLVEELTEYMKTLVHIVN